jgi:hypothetical protein
MKALKLLAIVAACSAAVLAAPVQAATFSFSFSNVDGAVNGDVSGTIVLPNGNCTLAETSMLIDSVPAALGLGPTPVDAHAGRSSENPFTVSAGDITSADFFGLIATDAAFFLDYASPTPGLTGIDLIGCACYASEGVLDIESSTR